MKKKKKLYRLTNINVGKDGKTIYANLVDDKNGYVVISNTLEYIQNAIKEQKLRVKGMEK